MTLYLCAVNAAKRFMGDPALARDATLASIVLSNLGGEFPGYELRDVQAACERMVKRDILKTTKVGYALSHAAFDREFPDFSKEPKHG